MNKQIKQLRFRVLAKKAAKSQKTSASLNKKFKDDILSNATFNVHSITSLSQAGTSLPLKIKVVNNIASYLLLVIAL